MARKTKLTLDDRARQRIAEDNPQVEYVRLNRQQICETEITSAVMLFLYDEDPISAHVLASAANEILSALSKGKAGVGLNDVRSFMREADVPTPLQDELFASLQHPYNFLKHSSADLEVDNAFPIDHIVMGLYTAIHGYKILFGTLPVEMGTFYSVVMAWKIREWWPEDPTFEMKLDAAHKMGLVGVSWQEFCAVGRRMVEIALEAEERTTR